MQQIAEDVGEKLAVKIKIDAKATLGTLRRQRSGRLKHVDTNELWLQERVAKGEFEVDKIPRVGNVADLMTHALL